MPATDKKGVKARVSRGKPGKTKAKSISGSVRAGTMFPVGRLNRLFK